jgi:hypothetical protein
VQGNIQDWLKLDEGDPGFQLLTEQTAAAIFFISSLSVLPISLDFSINMFSNFFLFFIFDVLFAKSDQPVQLSRISEQFAVFYCIKTALSLSSITNALASGLKSSVFMRSERFSE